MISGFQKYRSSIFIFIYIFIHLIMRVRMCKSYTFNLKADYRKTTKRIKLKFSLYINLNLESLPLKYQVYLLVGFEEKQFCIIKNVYFSLPCQIGRAILNQQGSNLYQRSDLMRKVQCKIQCRLILRFSGNQQKCNHKTIILDKICIRVMLLLNINFLCLWKIHRLIFKYLWHFLVVSKTLYFIIFFGKGPSINGLKK